MSVVRFTRIAGVVFSGVGPVGELWGVCVDSVGVRELSPSVGWCEPMSAWVVTWGTVLS